MEDLTGGSVVLHARTNGMDTGLSYQATGSVMSAQGWATVRVKHGGKTWQSTIDANVWAPGVYGWVEVN